MKSKYAVGPGMGEGIYILERDKRGKLQYPAVGMLLIAGSAPRCKFNPTQNGEQSFPPHLLGRTFATPREALDALYAIPREPAP